MLSLMRKADLSVVNKIKDKIEVKGLVEVDADSFGYFDDDKRERYIQKRNIMFFFSENKYCYCVTKDNKRIDIASKKFYVTLGAIMKKHDDLLRINRGCVMNPVYIKSVTQNNEGNHHIETTYFHHHHDLKISKKYVARAKRVAMKVIDHPVFENH